jgi:hypothetical protein
MAQQRRATGVRARTGAAAKRTTAAAKSSGRRVVGPKAVGRIEKSLDAAELALKDLRRELGRGSGDLVKNLDRTLKDSRKNLRSLNRTVVRDLDKMQKAATRGTAPSGGRTASPRGTAKATTSRRTTSSKSGAAKRSTGRSTTARGAGGRTTRSR